MCGIFAAIKTDGLFTDLHRRSFEDSTAIISYRGPDAQGTLALNSQSPGNPPENGFDIFLGHRRLSIIDLSSSGNQPMRFGHLYIVYNGEIFNYVELRDELIKCGHEFQTSSDTEVILHTYEEYGSLGFSRFNGMWAFVLVDLKKGIIICSRDRFSIKPLYYLNDDTNWYFASEIKQLLPYVRNRKLHSLLAYQFIRQQLIEHTNDTFFEGIYKVPAKSTLILNLHSGEHKIEQYWDFEQDHHLIREEEIIERFHALLDDSVRIRMRSDVNVGTLLSGGLDSSAITVLAGKYSKNRLSSFSVVTDEKKFSEEHFIDQLLLHDPHSNFKLRLKSGDIPGAIDRVLYHQDQPFVSLSIVAQHLMFKQIKKENDIKVILSGQGGDEILLGYLKYYFFNLIESRRRHRYGLIFRELLGSFINRTVLWQLEWNEMRRYLPMFAGSDLDFLKINGSPNPVWGFTSVIERQKQDIDTLSVPALTHYEDRNSMASSIESRLPFLDHRLVNLLIGIPVSMKMKNGWTKYILRKALHELPDTIRWRRDKNSFNTPEAMWLKNQLTPMVYEEFKQSSMEDAGLLDKRGFLAYYKEFLNGKPRMDPSLIFRIYIFEKWHKTHFN